MTFVIILLVVVVILLLGSQTSIGVAMLPEAVSDAVRQLIPRSLISDTTLSAQGEFDVLVNQAGGNIPVHVRQRNGMTFAWMDNSPINVPSPGTYAFSGWHHDLPVGSPINADKLKARIDVALQEALAPLGFTPASAESATIQISVFAADEDVVSLDTVTDAFNEPDGHQWATALQEAVQHDKVGEFRQFARGSLLLDVTKTDSGVWLRRAVGVADIVVDVSLAEKERRTRIAIKELLHNFVRKGKKSSRMPPM